MNKQFLLVLTQQFWVFLVYLEQMCCCGSCRLPIHQCWAITEHVLHIIGHLHHHPAPFAKSKVIPRYSWTGPCETLSGASCPNSFSIIPINSSSTSSFSWETFRLSTCQATVSCLPSPFCSPCSCHTCLEQSPTHSQVLAGVFPRITKQLIEFHIRPLTTPHTSLFLPALQ